MTNGKSQGQNEKVQGLQAAIRGQVFIVPEDL
jgi:hypothetical protein